MTYVFDTENFCTLSEEIQTNISSAMPQIRNPFDDILKFVSSIGIVLLPHSSTLCLNNKNIDLLLYQKI